MEYSGKHVSLVIREINIHRFLPKLSVITTPNLSPLFTILSSKRQVFEPLVLANKRPRKAEWWIVVLMTGWITGLIMIPTAKRLFIIIESL